MSVVNSISAAEANDHIRHGWATIVDARPQVMRHQGSLPGAVVVDPTDVDSRLAPTPSGTFPVVTDPDAEIAVVSVRSQAMRIAEQIADLGYTNVRYVDGGYGALRSATDRS
ncbi:rhodanese-like domain-containing protein [Gordonia sp. ABSL1-1]|uniref:rhodanese-like domain-containing protein n=1 Tax=Gordonia sp. ABSL1-1 TaxID=3053923 RepID=UPI00257393C3|nr:rhodanese-like domain-containing protein [Gordonia sp. ABSL1-1]MDL9938506.1 rhodanese-like domain-containing protein [Gordonia sp. ABSL1-1]